MHCDKNFRLIVVGKMRDRMMDARCWDFMDRLGRYGKCEITVLPDSDVEKEGAAIGRELDKERNSFLVVLSEEGKLLTTAGFAGKLQELDQKAIFVIGGPFGLSPAVKARADFLWSLSSLTFTHEMVGEFSQTITHRSLPYGNRTWP